MPHFRRAFAAFTVLLLPAAVVTSTTHTVAAAEPAAVWTVPATLGSYPSNDGDESTMVQAADKHSLALWVDGDTELTGARWFTNGTWGPVTYLPGRVKSFDVDTSGKHAVAVWDKRANGISTAYAATWDGTAWTTVALWPARSFAAKAAISADGRTAMATGYTYSSDETVPGVPRTSVLRNGTWTATEAADPQAWDDGILELNDNGTAATLTYEDDSTGYAISISRWDGTTWSTTTKSLSTTDEVHRVQARTTDGTSVVLISRDDRVDDNDPIIARAWTVTGTTWTQLGTDQPGDTRMNTFVANPSTGWLAYTLPTRTAGGTGDLHSYTGTWAANAVPGPGDSEEVRITAGDDLATINSLTLKASGIVRSDFSPATKTWSPTQTLTTDQVDISGYSYSTSADGKTSIASWLTSTNCATVCLRAAAHYTAAASIPILTSGPVITGTPRFGSILTCDVAYSSAESIGYQWNRGSAAISGATKTTYVPQLTDLANTLTCTTTGSNAAGETSPATSAATAAVALARALRNTKAPTINGKPEPGKRLTAKPGTWTPVAANYRWQWMSGGKLLKHGTKSRYKIPSRLVGKKITVRVTAIRPGHKAGTATSKKIRVKRQ